MTRILNFLKRAPPQGLQSKLRASYFIVKISKKTGKKTLTPKGDLAFFEKSLFDYDFVIGLDEVGVACLAGPVVAGCFAYPLKNETVMQYHPSEIVIDSKQLSEVQRMKAQALLEAEMAEHCYSGIGSASVEEIDKLNIYHASGLAMSRALFQVIDGIQKKHPKFRAIVFIDGNKIPVALRKLGANFEFVPVVKGDTKVFSIAAASIFAKNFRDTLMHKLGDEFPVFRWQNNVGYPTPEHKSALKSYGVTLHHRRSFAPVREQLAVSYN